MRVSAALDNEFVAVGTQPRCARHVNRTQCGHTDRYAAKTLLRGPERWRPQALGVLLLARVNWTEDTVTARTRDGGDSALLLHGHDSTALGPDPAKDTMLSVGADIDVCHARTPPPPRYLAHAG